MSGPLFKPTLYALRNRFRNLSVYQSESQQNFVILLFLALIFSGSYFGTRWVLVTLNQDPNLLVVPPSLPLSFILLSLSVMVFLAAIVASYDSFFRSHDLDLICASPVSGGHFFFARAVQVLITVSWMPLIMLFPILAAFDSVYGGGPGFYFLCLGLCLPYFLVPVSIAMLVALGIAQWPRMLRGPYLVLVCVTLALYGVIRFAMSFRSASISSSDHGDVWFLARVMTQGQVDWMPSYWTALVIENLLGQGTGYGGVLTLLLYASAAALFCSVSAAFHFLFERASDTSRSSSGRRRGVVSTCIERWSALIFSNNPVFGSLVRKDLLILSREVPQLIQFLMLSVLAGLYIWHLPSFVNQGVTTGDAIGVWYQRFMFIGNFSVGAFITIAACTRLVFPALSLEGKSLWIVQTAPISVREVIRLKMGIWIVPIATLSLALFTLGALYVGVSGLVIAVYGFTSLAIAYGVVGSACGLGARYARFDWEHPSQLCAGFGSLVYMIYSCALVTLSVFPTWAILFKTSDSFLAGAMNGSDLQLLLGNGMLIILINVVGAQIALRWGEYELRKSLGRGL